MLVLPLVLLGPGFHTATVAQLAPLADTTPESPPATAKAEEPVSNQFGPTGTGTTTVEDPAPGQSPAKEKAKAQRRASGEGACSRLFTWANPMVWLRWPFARS